MCYLTVTDKGYPKRLAFNYLEELQREFVRKWPRRALLIPTAGALDVVARRGGLTAAATPRRYDGEVESYSRPYAAIQFDTFIQKTKKLYVDTRTQRNLSKLNEDLADVQKIMTQNIQDVLGRGERLDSVMAKSSSLRDASGKYAKNARYLNTRAMLRKYGPVAFVALMVLGGLWWRFFR